MDIEKGAILFLHGLESGPMGTKACLLRERWRAEAVDLDTRAAIAVRDRAVAEGLPWNARVAGTEEAFSVPLQRTRDALKEKPRRLLIGSSFGGAVLMHLAAEGLWRGPSLLLASAGLKLTTHERLPPDHRAILIHGRDDDVVPLEDARRLSASSGPLVQLWEVGDEHRLPTILEDGTLDAAIRLLLSA